MKRGKWRWMASMGLALAALLTVLATIDAPGLVVDEPIQVGLGRGIVAVLRGAPLGFFDARTVYAVWHGGADRPPLTRVLAGMSHEWIAARQAGELGIDFDPKWGRPPSAFALALVVWLCTHWAWRLAGPVGGIVAGLACLLMPRCLAHAHLASPEVISAAFILAATASAGWAFRAQPGTPGMSTPRENSHRRAHLRLFARAGAAGIVLGAALLAKETSLLVPIAVLVALAVAMFPRRREVLPTAPGPHEGHRHSAANPLRRGALLVAGLVWLVVAAVVFVAGWPWLWPFDLPGYSPGWMGSIERSREFFQRAFVRKTIYVWYFGQRYPNAQSPVPWHFVWVYFLATVPVGLQFLGFIGLPRCVRRAKECLGARLPLAMIGTTLGIFSLPIHRYDGERLFLFVFPFWAIVVGIGAAVLVEWLSRLVSPRRAIAALAGFLVLQAEGTVWLHPYQLSYYNLMVGGLRGAERLGLEACYWGDCLDEGLLDRFAELAQPGQNAVLLPTLYEGHARYLSTPAMRAKRVRVLPEHEYSAERCQWALVFHRQGYLSDPDGLSASVFREGRLEGEVSRDGVWLGRLYRLR